MWPSGDAVIAVGNVSSSAHRSRSASAGRLRETGKGWYGCEIKKEKSAPTTIERSIRSSPEGTLMDGRLSGEDRVETLYGGLGAAKARVLERSQTTDSGRYLSHYWETAALNIPQSSRSDTDKPPQPDLPSWESCSWIDLR